MATAGFEDGKRTRSYNFTLRGIANCLPTRVFKPKSPDGCTAGMTPESVGTLTLEERFHPVWLRTEDLSPHRRADMLQDTLL
jgi:hypothetical protein